MLDRTDNEFAEDSELSIAISQVDVSKSVLGVSVKGFQSGSGAEPPVCFTLEPTKIVIKNKYINDAVVAISWQVVEFY